MDTKSTKIRRKRALKFFVILISCILFFLSTYMLQSLITVYETVGSIGLTRPFEQVSVLDNFNGEFAKLFREDTNRVINLAKKYKSDEAVKDGSAFAPIEESIKNSYQREVNAKVIEEKKNIIEDKYTYDYEKDMYVYKYAEVEGIKILNNFTSEEQIKADENTNGITTVNGIKYYKGYPLDAVKVDENKILNTMSSDLSYLIMSEQAQFNKEYEAIKKELASRKNFSYFIADRKTGDIYTNMDVKTIGEATKVPFNDEDFTFWIKDSGLNYSVGADLAFADYEYIVGESVYDISYSLDEMFSEELNPEAYDIFIHVNSTQNSIVDGDVYSDCFDKIVSRSMNVKQDISVFFTATVLWLVSIALLAVLAGEKDEDGKVKFASVDKVPSSVHTVFSIGLSVIILYGCTCAYYFWAYEANSYFTLVSALSVVANLVFIEWIMSTSRLVKNKMFLKNTIIYKLLIKNISKIKQWYANDNNKIMGKSIRKRILYPLAAFWILTLVMNFCVFLMGPDFEALFVGCILWGLLTVIAIAYAYRLTSALDSINSALYDAEQGEFGFNINTENVPVALRTMAERTNNLTNGLSVVIDEAVKNERTKTELITNVSHDLKTPLTSIITYTDLLKQCDIKDENAVEYIGVLEEKSNRLKTLVDDLVEASKASAGAVKLVLVQINLNQLIDQLFGEYEEALKENNLDLRCTVPDEDVMVVADGQKTYRIIENLFSNVKKYAMPGTRVYLNLETEERFAVISMKNVSRDELDFDVEHLYERFVRGDDSRSTEGSGLGLSIAKSLTELQGGNVKITSDGDLFKVVIRLPLEEKK